MNAVMKQDGWDVEICDKEKYFLTSILSLVTDYKLAQLLVALYLASWK